MIISLLRALFLRFRPTKVMENATVQDCSFENKSLRAADEARQP